MENCWITKGDSRIPCIEREDGDIITNDKSKTFILNDYFSKCFNNTIPPLTGDNCETYQNTSSNEFPEDLLCSEDEVLNLLYSLDVTKANAPDGISANMLKNTAHSIVSGVTIIFNLSLKNGELPTEWKVSAVNPIPKGTSKTKVTNYQPISLLSILSKLLEKHIHKLLLEHMECVSPLASQQWGFRSRRSTVLALIDATCVTGLRPSTMGKKSVHFSSISARHLILSLIIYYLIN